MPSRFHLDPRLEADTMFVAALGLCDVRLLNDRNYPWLVLVPRLPDAIEIVDLDPPLRHALIDDIARASEALRAVTGAEKLNVASFGNHVAQLHVHVIARFRDDAAWPDPVWGKAPAEPYAKEDRGRLVDALADRFA